MGGCCDAERRGWFQVEAEWSRLLQVSCGASSQFRSGERMDTCVERANVHTYLQEVMHGIIDKLPQDAHTCRNLVVMTDLPALLCDLHYQSPRCMARLLLSPKLMHARDAEPHHSPDGLATATHSNACCCMACALFPLSTHLSWVKFCNCWYAGSASHPIALAILLHCCCAVNAVPHTCWL
jgi:hypothetical protein